MSPTRYTPKTLFRIYPILYAAATVWLAREAWARHSTLWFIVLLGVAFITVRLVLGAFAWAEFDGETLVYYTPLHAEHRVNVAQLASAEMGGRRNEALIVSYYPRQENGLITVERRRFINMVPLNNQDDLLERLQARMPRA